MDDEDLEEFRLANVFDSDNEMDEDDRLLCEGGGKDEEDDEQNSSEPENMSKSKDEQVLTKSPIVGNNNNNNNNAKDQNKNSVMANGHLSSEDEENMEQLEEAKHKNAPLVREILSQQRCKWNMVFLLVWHTVRLCFRFPSLHNRGVSHLVYDLHKGFDFV